MLDVAAPTTEQVADWIESSLMVSSVAAIGIDRLAELANSDLQLAPNKLHPALSVMAKREKLIGDAYPFSVNEVAVVRRSGPLHLAYYSLVFLTPGSLARQTFRASETQVMGQLLEEISEAALTNFWGPGGEAVSFGYPSRHGRPKEFPRAVSWLANRMGIRIGSGYRPPQRRDGGVDVVAWRRFRDGRPGFPLALAQCTIQAETFTKTTDIDLRLWSSWLAMDTDPLSLLVLPGTIRAAGPEWVQLSTVVMVIDRIRLLELLSRGATPNVDYAWTLETLEGLRQLLAAGAR